MTTDIPAPPVARESREIVSFFVADALMGVPIDEVEEINHAVDLTPVPHAPPCVRGVINLRGEVVTVIDPCIVLGMGPTVITRKTCNVVVRTQGEPIGLLVDRMGDVVLARPGELQPLPANLAGADGPFFHGVYELPDTLLLVLNIEEVLAAEAAVH